MNPVLQWFTGNIGFHHVHHLNAKIPFYRLPEAMRSIPELQAITPLRLTPADIYRCLRLKLWDPARNRMVSFRGA
jgi:omega-6 fatty acid desaturase (delta-12 desaturase)